MPTLFAVSVYLYLQHIWVKEQLRERKTHTYVFHCRYSESSTRHVGPVWLLLQYVYGIRGLRTQTIRSVRRLKKALPGTTKAQVKLRRPMTDCSLSNVDLLPSSRDETASVHVSSLSCERRISDKTESISYPLKLKRGQQFLLLLFCFVFIFLF